MQTQLKTRWMEVLGYAGLIPFVALAGLAARLYHTPMADEYAHIMLLYAACILSFLGAVHWGIVLAQSAHETVSYRAGMSDSQFEGFLLIWGVTPSLIAWFVVWLAPVNAGLWIMVAVFALAYAVDRKILSPLKGFDDYLKLRTRLTLIACLSMAVSAWAW